MTFEKKFNKISRIFQIILLLIPFVNWITEVLVRWSIWNRKKSLGSLIIAVFVTIFGVVFGWVDMIWCLLFHHLCLANL